LTAANNLPVDTPPFPLNTTFKYNSAPIEEQQLRARQNVILELGYFLGKLGRSRVCALYSKGVEVPSDYSGVLFVPLDESGGWRLTLARELKAAGFAVDMNRAV